MDLDVLVERRDDVVGGGGDGEDAACHEGVVARREGLRGEGGEEGGVDMGEGLGVVVGVEVGGGGAGGEGGEGGEDGGVGGDGGGGGGEGEEVGVEGLVGGEEEVVLRGGGGGGGRRGHGFGGGLFGLRCCLVRGVVWTKRLGVLGWKGDGDAWLCCLYISCLR